MRIRLSDADRERIGGPEWLEVDMTRLTTSEALKLEEAGIPYGEFHSKGLLAILTRVYVGLLRAGVTPPAAAVDLDLDLVGMQAEADPSLGKASSPKGSTRIRSRSATTPPAKAGRSSRGKSPN